MSAQTRVLDAAAAAVGAAHTMLPPAARGSGSEEEGGERPPWLGPLLASVLISTIVVDICGNLLVIVSVLRNRKLRNVGNVFVVSLAVADLLVAVYPYPLVVQAIVHDGWTMGDLHCQISGFFMGLSVIGSVFNIMAIALNRYCYICHSFYYDRLYGTRKTLAYVSGVWLLTLTAILPNLFVGSLQYDARVYSCTFSQSVSTAYTVSVVFFHFLLPIGVVVFCYLRIWVLVIQVRRRARNDARLGLTVADYRNFLTMFVVFVLFAVCWGPLNVIGLVVTLSSFRSAPMQVPGWLFVASYFLAYFNSCLNAVVYGLLNHNFRREYKRILLVVCTPWQCFFLKDASNESNEDLKSKSAAAGNKTQVQRNSAENKKEIHSDSSRNKGQVETDSF
uniref:Melatonin receptor type 1A-A-like n=1 Tax=Petromyzon marinus TaxID=7757 RepID=A0AAJ7T8G6_PETMA|nr:melatonin receptor type 1A-A-like [Petromyzon marinus]